MATTSNPRDTVLEQLKGLSEGDGRWVVESYIWGSSKAKASRKRDPDAPKKEVQPDSYFHLNNGIVWPLLKAYIEANKEELGEERCKELKGVKARTQISSAIWAGIKDMDSEARIEAMEAIDQMRVVAALESWTTAPPETRYKAKDGASATSGGSKKSKGSSGSKKLAEMSEEERKAFYKARAAKAAATKAAKKADAAGGASGGSNAAVGGGPAAEADEDFEAEADDADAAEATLQPKPIELDFGRGKQTFGYIEHAGTRYIFKTTGELLGALNPSTGKLRKVKPEENPFA
jgi:hypothetical protein